MYASSQSHASRRAPVMPRIRARAQATSNIHERAERSSRCGPRAVPRAPARPASARAQTAPPSPAAATKRSVEHRYFGTPVRDDYQWMEDWRDPSLKPWVAAQNAYTRGVLDKLPSRTAIRSEERRVGK